MGSTCFVLSVSPRMLRPVSDSLKWITNSKSGLLGHICCRLELLWKIRKLCLKNPLYKHWSSRVIYYDNEVEATINDGNLAFLNNPRNHAGQGALAYLWNRWIASHSSCRVVHTFILAMISKFNSARSKNTLTKEILIICDALMVSMDVIELDLF